MVEIYVAGLIVSIILTTLLVSGISAPKINRLLLALLVSASSLWGLVRLLFYTSPDQDIRIILFRASIIIGTLSAYLFLLYALHSLNRYIPKIKLVSYVTAISSFAISFAASTNIYGIQKLSGSGLSTRVVEYGLFYPIYFMSLLFLTSTSFYLLWFRGDDKKTHTNNRLIALIVYFALLINIIIGFERDIIGYVPNIVSFWFGYPIAVLAMVGIIVLIISKDVLALRNSWVHSVLDNAVSSLVLTLSLITLYIIIYGLDTKLDLQRVISILLIYSIATISTLEGLLIKSKSLTETKNFKKHHVKTIENYTHELKSVLNEIYKPVDIWLIIGEATKGRESSRLSEYEVSMNHSIKDYGLTVEMGKRSDGFIYDEQDRKLIKSLVASYESSINQILTNTKNTAELVESNKMKDEFISLASHQLRTPLSIAAITNKMILEGSYGDISKAQKKVIVESQENIDRMVLIVNDLLETARINVGSFRLDMKPFDITKSLHSLVRQYEKTSKFKGINIKFKSSYKQRRFVGDEHKMMEVVANFLDNAIKYSQNGTSILMTLEQEDKHLLLKVRDSGIGVSESDQHKLFTKFGRTDLAISKSPDGMGLGLYLAKKIVEGHMGTIVFSSELGKGSVFGFKIPIV